MEGYVRETRGGLIAAAKKVCGVVVNSPVSTGGAGVVFENCTIGTVLCASSDVLSKGLAQIQSLK